MLQMCVVKSSNIQYGVDEMGTTWIFDNMPQIGIQRFDVHDRKFVLFACFYEFIYRDHTQTLYFNSVTVITIECYEYLCAAQLVDILCSIFERRTVFAFFLPPVH